MSQKPGDRLSSSNSIPTLSKSPVRDNKNVKKSRSGNRIDFIKDQMEKTRNSDHSNNSLQNGKDSSRNVKQITFTNQIVEGPS